MEEWRDIRGYEGLYQISNKGRVKSLDRRVVNRKNGATRSVYGIILTPFDNGRGYLMVGLHNSRKRKNYYLHRLVADAFLGHAEDENYINHKDYNTHNNCVGNLEWCTQHHNINHSLEHMRKPKTKTRTSNTGEKYISCRILNGGRSVYRVTINHTEKTFKELRDAILYRNEVMEKWQSQ